MPPESVEGMEGHSFSFMHEMLSMGLTLGAVLLFILILGWALKKMMQTRVSQGNNKSLIKIIERRNLAPKSAVYLLEVRGETFLVGETPSGLHCLGRLGEEGGHSTFENVLGQQLQKGKE